MAAIDPAVEELVERLLELAWSLWTELGVAGPKRNHAEVAILPEVLLVFTAPLLERDARLRDEVLGWCLEHQRWIGRRQLVHVLAPLAEPAQFGDLAAAVSVAGGPHWTGHAVGTPSRSPGPLVSYGFGCTIPLSRYCGSAPPLGCMPAPTSLRPHQAPSPRCQPRASRSTSRRPCATSVRHSAILCSPVWSSRASEPGSGVSARTPCAPAGARGTRGVLAAVEGAAAAPHGPHRSAPTPRRRRARRLRRPPPRAATHGLRPGGRPASTLLIRAPGRTTRAMSPRGQRRSPVA